MKKQKRIKLDELPVIIPLTRIIVWQMVMDFYNMPSWVYGVVYTLWILMVIGATFQVWNTESISIFKDKQE